MSVKIRKQGTKYQVDIHTVTPDGVGIRERRVAPVSTPTAAKEWAKARERHLAIYGNKKPEPEREKKEVPTLEEFAERFIADAATKWKPSSVAAKRTCLRTHLIPVLGAKRLDAITGEDISLIRQRLKTLGRTAKTTNNTLVVLSTLLKTAIDFGVIPTMSCSIKITKVEKRRRGFHDFGDYDRLLVAAKAVGWQAYLICLLGGRAGLRLGEMMALEWSDIRIWHDGLRWRGQIAVSRSEWKGIVTGTKGYEARTIPLRDELLAALRETQLRPCDRVLVQRDRSPMTMKLIQTAVKKSAQLAGVRSGVHLLRHTFCSHLAMKGAASLAIQGFAGHKNLKTTEGYMHLSDEVAESMMSLLDREASGSLTASDPQNEQNEQIP